MSETERLEHKDVRNDSSLKIDKKNIDQGRVKVHKSLMEKIGRIASAGDE